MSEVVCRVARYGESVCSHSLLVRRAGRQPAQALVRQPLVLAMGSFRLRSQGLRARDSLAVERNQKTFNLMLG